MRSVTAGAEDVSTYVMLVDSASGAPETGYTIADLDLSYVRELSAPSDKVDAVALGYTGSLHADNSAIEIDATDMEGLYRVDWPNAAFAAGVSQVTLYCKGVGLAPAVETIMIGAPVDVTAISGDTTAADNFEAMLDGTGGVTLSLGQLAIVASGSDNAIIATGSGTGAGIISTGGASGGCGAVFLGDDGAIPSGIAYGMAIHSGELNGGGLSVLAEGIVEPAIKAVANRSDGVQFTAGSGGGGSGIKLSGDAGGDGLEISPGATGDGIRVAAGITGDGISVAGGSTSGDAISATTAGSGAALNTATLALINAEADTAINDASLATAASLATVDGIVDSILDDTAEIGTAGAGLTEAGGTGDQLTAVATAAALTTVDYEVGSMQLDVTSILDDTAEIGTAGAGLTEAGGTGDHLGDLGGMSTAMKAEVNAEADAALTETAVWHADIHFTRDQGNSQDEYITTWFKNGIRQTTGITTPLIQVIKRADGTDLIASTAMTQIGSTGSYKYDATGGARMSVGEASLVVVTATIESSARTFSKVTGRDSAT